MLGELRLEWEMSGKNADEAVWDRRESSWELWNGTTGRVMNCVDFGRRVC